MPPLLPLAPLPIPQGYGTVLAGFSVAFLPLDHLPKDVVEDGVDVDGLSGRGLFVTTG